MKFLKFLCKDCAHNTFYPGARVGSFTVSRPNDSPGAWCARATFAGGGDD
ncbi:MAG: hypothetical protein GXX09_07290 [Syntrophomonadaceae bacterium]|nr:hypothetical protein [Syntrophomonadaceae bacterium]